MNIENIYNKFEEIKNTNGSNVKKALLSKYKNDTDFVFVLEFLFNTYKKTGIATKKIEKNIKMEVTPINDLKALIDYVVNENTGTDYVIKVVQDFINKNKKHEIFLKELITKTYKCGLTSTTINKIIPNLIPTFGVMLASKVEDCNELYTQPEVIATTKLDGFRCVYISSHKKFYSRQGLEIEGLIELKKEMEQLPDGVYDGELLAVGDFKEAKDQYKATSKIASKKGEKTGLKLVLFDYIKNEQNFFDGIDPTPCYERKFNLIEIIKNNNCKLIENAEVLYFSSYKENKIIQLVNELTTRGEEGLMLNIANAPYECKRTKTLLKIKKFYTMDLRVIGFTEGNGDMKGMLGSLIVDYKGNKVNVGSGFNQAQRIEFWNNRDNLINRVIEVGYKEETNNEDGGLSLRFPTFKQLREIGKEVSYF